MTGALRPRSFHARLLLAFVGLLTLAILIAGTAVSITTTRKVESQMRENLAIGARVLDSFLGLRRAQLAASVRVLSNDFGFRSAVATDDTATIASVLENHGRRIDADLVALVNARGELLSSTDVRMLAEGFPFRAALDAAAAHGESAGVGAFGGRIFQYFVVPVRAPNPIAWVTMGFLLDEAIAAHLARLTDLSISFVNLGGDAPVVVTTLAPDEQAVLGATVPADLRPLDQAASVDAIGISRDGRYLSLAALLDGHPDSGVAVVLKLPTRAISDTQWLLVRQLALVLAVALAVTIGCSLLLARRMSDPVRRLITAARQIEVGQYDTPVEIQHGGDLARLGTALNLMQSRIREREERIRRQAFVDPLTELPNRLGLEARLADLTDGQAFTLVLFELVDRVDISFGLGHAISDRLLRILAGRLAAQDGVSDVARTGADVLAVRLPDCAPQVLAQQVRRLKETLELPADVDGRSVTSRVVAATIGYPADAADPESLLRNVETMLEVARKASDGVASYLPGQVEVRARQLAIIAGFDAALRDDQFRLCFQPKVSLPAREVCECEALLRWTHPVLGFIRPDEFVLLAERSGNIRRVTDWVIDAAIRQAAEWNRRGMAMRVAVNLSAHDLADAGLHQVVRDGIARYGADGSMLTLEITESAVLRDRDRAAEMLLRLKGLGIRLSIDDFGTGHSSLAQLRRLPVDELKIDKSFVLELDRSPDDAMIVRSIVELGHNLGLEVVAEGAETAEVLQRLIDFGCDKVQGYLFSRPLECAAFTEWVYDFNGRRPAVATASR